MKKRKFNWKLLLLIGGIFILHNNNVLALENDYYLVNNYNIGMTETEYNNLINLGFTDFEIMNLELNEFNNNKDLIGEVVSTTTKYYRNTYLYDLNDEIIAESEEELTEEEYNSSDPEDLPISLFGLTTGYTETNMKEMTTTITSVSGGYRYKVLLHWKSNPVRRDYDIIGIGIESNKVYNPDSPVFKQTYCTSSSNCTNSSTAAIKEQSSGVGASFDLPEGTFTKLESYLYFDVAKRNSSDNISELNAIGDYKHATSSTSSSDADCYNINLGGINLFSSVIDKYDTIPTANARWTGSW